MSASKSSNAPDESGRLRHQRRRLGVARAYGYTGGGSVARLRGRVALYVSPQILAEYEEVLRRPRLKLQPPQIDSALAALREVAHVIEPTRTLSVSAHESDNRFLECAEAAEADYLVTGNTRHFPQSYQTTQIVTGRRFLDILAESEQ